MSYMKINRKNLQLPWWLAMRKRLRKIDNIVPILFIISSLLLIH